MTQRLPFHSSEARPIRVLLVCRERVIRAALRALIDGQTGTHVIGEVENLDTAQAAILSDRPDVTLLDPDHYGDDGVLTDLLQAVANTRTILLTGSPNSVSVSKALENGAAGLVLKQAAPEVLLKAIDKVHAGEFWFDRVATARLLAELSRTDGIERRDLDTEQNDPDEQRRPLTRRERQVVALVGEGLRNSQIADRLRISEITVRNHLTSTFRKLAIPNRFQLAIYAFQHGLATLPTHTLPIVASPNRRMLAMEYQKKTS